MGNLEEVIISNVKWRFFYGKQRENTEIQHFTVQNNSKN